MDIKSGEQPEKSPPIAIDKSIENINTSNHNEKEDGTSDGTPYSIDPVLQKRLVRKLDLRLTCWVFFGYFANNLDRNNLQNAYTMGMDKDLDIASDKFNWAATMFFIGYTVLQIPGNIIITKFSPRWFLPSCAITWGAIVCFMSLVKDYKALWGLRFCLGVAEAPYYAGVIFVLGSWYTKEELAKRIMFFVIGDEVAGIVGGFIAGGISDTMDYAAGLPAWKWLFIVEGLVGVVIGITGYFVLPSFPHDTRWLTPEERSLAVLRVESQGKQVISKAYNWRTVRNVLLNPYSWLLIIIYTFIMLSRHMQHNFAIILRDIGYPVGFVNYMLAPLFAYSAIAALIIGYSSDRFGDRAFHIVVVEVWVGIWCLVMAAINRGNNSAPLVFLGTYATCMGNPVSPLLLTWANEIYKSDHNTRAVSIAFISAIANLITSFITVEAWVVSDSPQFFKGKLTSMSSAFASAILTILVWSMLRIKFMLPKAIGDKEKWNDEKKPIGEGIS
ncbi:major facilitator superfamily domain-containing protein [Phascolomyces articulosus]|uniref:Major facilitator superfamily domain-containing protein n=1 Tax=Phascolomyces articulosus TaxID=60185 RepID=A0AAD5KK87_9FUNG|nr:major facilitator superfamily domain-containing protein [Phascolomyces articulosus]